MKSNWWEKEPLRIFEICSAFNLNFTDQKHEAFLHAGMKTNAVHKHCMDMKDSHIDENKFYFKTALAKKENKDILKDYVPFAHKHGIKVIVYFNVHAYSPDFGKSHVDWVQLKEDGSPVDKIYELCTSMCINSPYREWAFQILRDLCKYPIDGIFYDGPIFFDSTCYCKYCREKFKTRYNLELPSKSDRKSPGFRRLVEFQSDSLSDFLKDSNKTIKDINPNIVFYMNGNILAPTCPTGRVNRKIIEHTDILGAEGGFLYGNLRKASVWKPGITAKLLESQSPDKQRVIFSTPGHKRWSFYLLPEMEIRLLCAETIANGSNIWMAAFPDDLREKKEMDAIRDYFSFIGRNKMFYHNTRSIAKVALVWSEQTSNFYTGSEVPLSDFTKSKAAEGPGNMSSEFSGFCDLLSHSLVPFDVIDENTFDNIKKYRLVILPNSACLSKKQVELLKSYVAEGGILLGTFESSLYDEFGKKQDNFRLKDIFGIESIDKVMGPFPYDYIMPLTKTGLLKEITKVFLPAPKYGISVKTSTGVNLAGFSEKLKGCYERTPVQSKNPFIVHNKFKKGHCLYMAGTFGESYDEFQFQEYLQILKNIIAFSIANDVKIENTPSSIYVSLRKIKDHIILHLVNYTGEMTRPIKNIVTLKDVSLTVKGLKKVKSVKTLREKHVLRYKTVTGGVKFTLPILKEYEVVVIKVG